MQPVSLYSFRKKVSLYKKNFNKYLRRVEKLKPQGLDDLEARGGIIAVDGDDEHGGVGDDAGSTER